MASACSGVMTSCITPISRISVCASAASRICLAYFCAFLSAFSNQNSRVLPARSDGQSGSWPPFRTTPKRTATLIPCRRASGSSAAIIAEIYSDISSSTISRWLPQLASSQAIGRSRTVSSGFPPNRKLVISFASRRTILGEGSTDCKVRARNLRRLLRLAGERWRPSIRVSYARRPPSRLVASLIWMASSPTTSHSPRAMCGASVFASFSGVSLW